MYYIFANEQTKIVKWVKVLNYHKLRLFNVGLCDPNTQKNKYLLDIYCLIF